MQKVLICYFSGTGNTKMVAEQYKKDFTQTDTSVLLFDICQTFKDNGKTIDLTPLQAAATQFCGDEFLNTSPTNDLTATQDNLLQKFQSKNDDTSRLLHALLCFDLIGFAYPIHAFNCPQLFYAFLKKLPKGLNKPVFVFKTSGEPLKLNDGSDFLVNKCLKKLGCTLQSTRHIVMPYNIIIRHQDGLVKQMWQKATQLILEHTAQLLDKTAQKQKQNLFRGLNSLFFRIEWSGAKLIGKGFKATDTCKNCKQCQRLCPTNNISFTSTKPIFGKHCCLCMRCVQNCPTDSIKIGILNKWRVNGTYDIQKISNDATIDANYITKDTKGLKSIYKRYFLTNSNTDIDNFK